MSGQRWMLAGAVSTPEQVVEDGLVVVEGKRIVFAGRREDWKEPLADQVTQVKDGWITPGFIDVHIHGTGGFDTMDGTPASVRGMARVLARYGITGFLATTTTGDLEDVDQAVRVAAEAAAQDEQRGVEEGARVLGIHLEGPWINRKFKGAQNEEYIVPPYLSDVKRIVESANGYLRLVTVAPEVPEAEAAIRYLSEHGVKVSAGHTAATYDEVTKAVEHGVSHFTHCFNAMRGLHHREPGVVGAAMVNDHATSELIADGIHVHPAVMKILYKVKKQEKLVLISDAIRAAGMPEGVYDLGGQDVNVANGQATLADGTLAGSVLSLNRAVRNMVELCGVPLHEAVNMASHSPAEAIGFGASKGKLAAGYDADIVVLNSSYGVAMTFVEGTKVV